MTLGTYKIVKETKMAEGGYGEVWKCRAAQKDTLYALKEIRLQVRVLEVRAKSYGKCTRKNPAYWYLCDEIGQAQVEGGGGVGGVGAGVDRETKGRRGRVSSFRVWDDHSFRLDRQQQLH